MTRAAHTLRVLETLIDYRSGHLYRKGARLSSGDNRTVREVYFQFILLLHDLGYLTLDPTCRTARRIYRDMLSRDVYVVLSASEELVSLIRNKDIKGFKAPLSRISQHLNAVLRDSFESVSHSSAIEAKRLIQLFSYMGRLSLKDIDLKDQCIGDYLESENLIQDVPEGLNLINNLRPIIHNWVKRLCFHDLRFDHGPGSVAFDKNKSIENKYSQLKRDSLIDLVFGQSYYTGNNPVKYDLVRRSQTIFVPKSYKTFRTISMESPTLMYLQQGVWKEIERGVNSNTWLVNRIGFSDQTRNQRLAREGSINRNYATIDLSAASDSVSWDLVCKLFSGTALFPYLVATRSTHTRLPNGETIELKKFAPMGSALCFPIETIIFAAIAHHSVEKVRRLRGMHVSRTFSVYGDDIIVPTDVVPELLWELSVLGFRVNTSKSFVDETSWFRESCGKEYCDGFDVTPMRISRNYRSVLLGVESTGLVDMCNEAFAKGFLCLRAYLLKRLTVHHYTIKDNILSYVPYFSPNHLHGFSYTNFHAKVAYRPDLYARQIYHTGISDDTKKGKNDELRLRYWLEKTRHRQGPIDVAFRPKIGQIGASLKPTSSLES